MSLKGISNGSAIGGNSNQQRQITGGITSLGGIGMGTRSASNVPRVQPIRPLNEVQRQQSVQQQTPSARPSQPAVPPQQNKQPSQPVKVKSRPKSNVASLKKGQKVALSKEAAKYGASPSSLNQIHVGLGWDINPQCGFNFDLDAFIFATKGDGKVRDERDFIFFNNLSNENGSIQHLGDNRTGAGAGDDEVINIRLNSLPYGIEKIVFAVTITDESQSGLNFGMVKNAFVRLVDSSTGKEFLRFELADQYGAETAIVVGEVYLHNGEWKFQAVGSGFNAGLPALCSTYGVDTE